MRLKNKKITWVGWGEREIKHLEKEKHSNQLSRQRTNTTRVRLEVSDDDDGDIFQCGTQTDFEGAWSGWVTCTVRGSHRPRSQQGRKEGRQQRKWQDRRKMLEDQQCSDSSGTERDSSVNPAGIGQSLPTTQHGRHESIVKILTPADKFLKKLQQPSTTHPQQRQGK